MSAERIHKTQPISGFPEWLPEHRLVELQWLDRIRAVFESFGFCSIETPSVEELEVLLAKGETDKEIYTLQRLHADPEDSRGARLGLHYDLTVPLARYVAQHFQHLVFPFKRYQIQRVWRGERPQEGRYREFYQCDIDVIAQDELPLHFDAEMPLLLHHVLRALDVGEVQLRVSNRKVLDGYLQGLGVEQPVQCIRILDKFAKVGVRGVQAELEQLGLSLTQREKAVKLATIQGSDAGVAEQVRGLGVRHDLLDQGLEELSCVMETAAALPAGSVVADLSVARGFDYYTGTVYEGSLVDFPALGSVCSGGRYDDLAGSYINKKLPGVGVSLGVTRMFGKMVAEGRVGGGPKCPTDVMVVVPNEQTHRQARKTAHLLRQRGLNVELFHEPAKMKVQLRYAARKGIPFVWFPPFAPDGGDHEVKDMATGEQQVADASSWDLPGEFLIRRQRVL